VVTFTSVQIDTWVAGAFLPFLRLLALFSTAPILSHRSFPARSRVALAAVMAALIAPFALVPAGLTLNSASTLGLVVQQLSVGLTLGFAARMVFAVFEIAGEAVGLQMGLSFAGFFNPAGGHQSVVSSWLNTMAMMVFLALNGHLMLMDALVTSCQVFPITADPMMGLQLIQLDKLGAEVFRLALVLALPPSIMLLFINLVLGYVSRVAPQLNIMAVGFPATLLAGLAWLALGTDHILVPIDEAMRMVLGPLR
jgi:flagellar biosynthetic protein FliR